MKLMCEKCYLKEIQRKSKTLSNQDRIFIILLKICPSKQNFSRIYFESSMFSNFPILQMVYINNNL